MIRKSETLSMIEATEYMPKSKEENSEIKDFIKKFTEISLEDGKKLRQKLMALELMKVRDTHISKIIDVLPENSEEVNKIFVDVGLNEDETKKILDTVKEFK